MKPRRPTFEAPENIFAPSNSQRLSHDSTHTVFGASMSAMFPFVIEDVVQFFCRQGQILLVSIFHWSRERTLMEKKKNSPLPEGKKGSLEEKKTPIEVSSVLHGVGRSGEVLYKVIWSCRLGMIACESLSNARFNI